MSKTDLSTWYSMEDLVQILKKAPRTINEKLQRGIWSIERRDRSMPERKPEPCFNPRDVDKLVLTLNPKPHVIPDSLLSVDLGGREPDHRERTHHQDVHAQVPIVPAAFMERALSLIERFAPPLKALPAAEDRGPWLPIKAAAAQTGLSKTMIRNVAHQLHREGSPDVIHDGSLKIRQKALDELDGVKLRLLMESHRAAGKAAVKKAAASGGGEGGTLRDSGRNPRVNGVENADEETDREMAGESSGFVSMALA